MACPGLRPAQLLAYIDQSQLPDRYQGDPDQIRALEDSTSFKTTTLGPVPPPASFDRVAFLNYLISVVYDARRLDWIKGDGAQESLLSKLITAKRKFEQGDVAGAKTNLSAFVNEVEGTSCDDFNCPGNKPSTSEAHGLLKFNAEYLISQIP